MQRQDSVHSVSLPQLTLHTSGTQDYGHMRMNRFMEKFRNFNNEGGTRSLYYNGYTNGRITSSLFPCCPIWPFKSPNSTNLCHVFDKLPIQPPIFSHNLSDSREEFSWLEVCGYISSPSDRWGLNNIVNPQFKKKTQILPELCSITSTA